MKKNLVRIVIILFIIMINMGCDQSTKYLAKRHFQQPMTKYEIKIIGDFFVLKYAENNGGFLSQFSNLPKIVRMILLSVLPSIVMLLAFMFLIYKKDLSIWYVIALSTLIGGGFSNLFDRLTNNEYVIDFMNMGIGSLRTGIFNFADLSIMAGAVMLLFLQYRDHKKNRKTLKPDTTE